jgi:hypothetical protein
MKTTKQQLYSLAPTTRRHVSGQSSKSIFTFMTTGMQGKCLYHPRDVDDWERNRALLLCYPEWRARLHEMHVISPEWKILVENWSRIEAYYEEDYSTFGHNAFGKGECDKFIRSLLKIVNI